MFIIAGVWCDASGLWMRLKMRSLLGQDRTPSFHRASGQLVFINVLVYKNINAMFECYPRQERMKEWQKRSCRLQRSCLILLQKTQGDTRRVRDCQKHPCQLACLISIRCFIVSTIPSMKSSQAYLARNAKTSPELPWGCRWDGGCARYRLHKSLIPCQRWEDTKEGIPQPLKLDRNSANVPVDSMGGGFEPTGRVAKCQIFYTDQNLQTRFYPEKSA